MSTNAQRVQLGPFFSSGALQGAAKLYHYEAGTSTLKNIWEERAKSTTLAQPFVADAEGIFNFYADGLYKFIICGPNSTGPSDDVLYTLDNWAFLDPSDPAFEEGDVVASSSTIAIGPEIFVHVSGSTDIDTITLTAPFAWIVFDGNLTLNYSANLLTPASINLAVRQGDVVFVLDEGSGVVRVAAHYHYDGLLIATEDSRTNSVDPALTVRSTTSGTPAAGIGTGIKIQAESADETPSDVGQLEFVYSDVSAGSEDSYFQILLRVAGAALTACYRFVATGAFKAIFTHANSADRTYTLPNYDGTLATLAGTETLTNKTLTSPTITGNTVGTGALKTSTGSASGHTNGAADLSLNDYSFFPNFQQTSLINAHVHHNYPRADTGTTIGAIRFPSTADASDTYVVRWRYITASDDPTIWVARHLLTGAIHGIWASDDPLSNGMPGLRIEGCESVLMKARDLEHLSALSAKATEAADMIRDRKLKMQHQAYRALQLTVQDEAPAKWLFDNCEFDSRTRLLRMK